MKQEESVGGPGAAPKESKSSGDTNDAPSAVLGGGDGVPATVSGGKAGDDSTSPELNTSANTSGSSLGGDDFNSSCSETAENMPVTEQSVSSCNDSVSESIQRDRLSSCSGSSIHSGVEQDKSERDWEDNKIDNSYPASEAVSNFDGLQAETADGSLSESDPRDSSSSSSVTSTPSRVSERSERNSGASDMDNSPSNPPLEAAPSSDERQTDGVGDTLNDLDAASDDAGSASLDKNKMTLRSGKVTKPESVVPKKQRDTNKMQKKSSARPTKRRCSVDEQNHSFAEENPEKLLRFDSSDASTLHDTEYNISFVNNPSGDIKNVSAPPPKEDSKILVKADDVPLREASDTTPAEQGEAVMGNEKTESTNISEVTPDNQLNAVVKKEVLDESINSESSAYQSADNITDMDIGCDVGVGICVKLEVPEKHECNAPSGSNSGVSTEDIKGTRPDGPERRASRDSESSSDEKEFAANSANAVMFPEYEDESCCEFEECSLEAVDNALQENVETFTVEIGSGSRQMSPDVRTALGQSVTTRRFGAHSFFVMLHSNERYERNVRLNAEENVRGESTQPASQALQRREVQESTAVPDSSTEEIKAEITPDTDTNVQQQMPTNVSHSFDAVAATDETNCASQRHDGPSECTEIINNNLPPETRNTAASVAEGTECKNAENVHQDTRDLESPGEAQFEQRNLQIYRYITASGASDVRYSPYVTRRRPLRSGFAGGENYRRMVIRRQRREARQTDDNGLETESGGRASFGDNCNIS